MATAGTESSAPPVHHRSTGGGADGDEIFMFKLKPKPKAHKWRPAPRWPKDPAHAHVREARMRRAGLS
jgi:hypothetical protein